MRKSGHHRRHLFLVGRSCGRPDSHRRVTSSSDTRITTPSLPSISGQSEWLGRLARRQSIPACWESWPTSAGHYGSQSFPNPGATCIIGGTCTSMVQRT